MHPTHTLFNRRQVFRAECAQLFANTGFVHSADWVAQGHRAGFVSRGRGHDERGSARGNERYYAALTSRIKLGCLSSTRKSFTSARGGLVLPFS
jgi:hypothetical protein